MHSLWPFASDNISPASYEKALSKLSAQITTTTVTLDKFRTRAHRSKTFWTLWSTLAYLVYTSILVLVLGPQQWNGPHYAGLAGAPIAIYGIRKLVEGFWGWNVERQSTKLDRLIAERDEKIGQLKKVTKYDTTQELLNKYGGNLAQRTPSTRAKQGSSKVRQKRNSSPARTRSPQQQPQHMPRTGLVPPPTANIPGRQLPSKPLQHSPHSLISDESRARSVSNPSPIANPDPREKPFHLPNNAGYLPDEPGFAPNAFPAPPRPPLSRSSSAAYSQEPQHKWYDRILDVMLGEDENLAKNRLVLLCNSCRLVNGQAPAGVKRIEEIGRWRCGSCGAWNGVEEVTEREVGRMMQEMHRQEKTSHRNHGSEHIFPQDASPSSPVSTTSFDRGSAEADTYRTSSGKPKSSQERDTTSKNRSAGISEKQEIPDSASDLSEDHGSPDTGLLDSKLAGDEQAEEEGDEDDEQEKPPNTLSDAIQDNYTTDSQAVPPQPRRSHRSNARST